MLARISKRFVYLSLGKKKRPTDMNQNAKSIVDIATGESEDTLKEKDAIKAGICIRSLRRFESWQSKG
jgi:hypothetical protein